MTNLLTVSAQKGTKLNQLMRELGDTDLASARWLRAQGYSSSLLARYVRSGWLNAPARGVYTNPRASLHWAGVMQSLQQREALRLHVGGRFALAWRGHEHYLRFGTDEEVTLYGPDRLPGWVTKLTVPERFAHRGRGPFPSTSMRFASEADDERLFQQGLELEADANTSGAGVVMASNERAALELCDEPPSTAQILEADAVMQGLNGLRPDQVHRLLCRCTSVKAKRLFLALAERHNHAWLARVSLDDVDLGSGKRVLAPGGRLHPKYQITLPVALDEHLG
ncbi:MAG: type IV toxin-antitoxin system AbiEi family antitoxin domain-containing protein [Rhodanobacteraceae bacterium]|nr:type IV toxin-antitoxin system AbiEi family antitoxin domain-containing protein [Rhodanobacteraceae bacterium]